MAKQKPTPPLNWAELTPLYKLGDRVRILRSGGLSGPIVEFRGPLGPGGALIYRVRVRGKPRPAYIEVREDQLVAMPDET